WRVAETQRPVQRQVEGVILLDGVLQIYVKLMQDMKLVHLGSQLFDGFAVQGGIVQGDGGARRNPSEEFVFGFVNWRMRFRVIHHQQPDKLLSHAQRNREKSFQFQRRNQLFQR